MLWRFEFFVQGKHLETVLASVSGIAVNMQPPQPVANGVVETVKGVKKIKAKHEGNTIVGQIISWATSLTPDTVVGTPQIIQKSTELGGTSNGSTYYTDALLKSGVLKRRSRGVFVRTKKEG